MLLSCSSRSGSVVSMQTREQQCPAGASELGNGRAELALERPMVRDLLIDNGVLHGVV